MKNVAKSNVVWLTVLLLVCTIIGCDTSDDVNPANVPRQSSKQAAASKTEAKNQENASQTKNPEVDRLKNITQKQEDQIKSLNQEIIRLTDTIKKEKWKLRFLIAVVTLITGIPLSLIVGLSFGKSQDKIKTNLVEYECPKCHWELPPDTTRCPNPDCQTRLR